MYGVSAEQPNMNMIVQGNRIKKRGRFGFLTE